MDLGLKDKNVVITGGSKGIGLACAKLFAQEGANINIISRNKNGLPKDKEFENNRIQTITADLTKPEDIAKVSDAVTNADILVNNAGGIPGGDLESIAESDWKNAWELKVFAYLRLSKLAIQGMRNRKNGVIVNIIGMAGVAPRYDYVCGSMANAALMAFTKAMGAKSTNFGVRVVGINPGPTETDRLVYIQKQRALKQFGDETKWRELLKGLPFGRAAHPEEIANIAVFVASARSSYLSGVVIDADGGANYS